MFERLRKKEEGQVLIMVSILMVVLISFTALIVDVGYLYAEKRQLQNAVDSAALSGVLVAKEENGDVAKVHQEVDKYLLANLNKQTDNRIIEIDMSEPITVAVDLTTDYPAFFSRIFQKATIDIHAHAKAIVHELEIEPFSYTVFSETDKITLNGSQQELDGPIYSKEKSNLDLNKVTISDSDPNQNRSPEDLIETAADGEQFLPDYSEILNLPAKKMTLSEFKTEYLNTGNKLSGVVVITDPGDVKVKGHLEGKGVLYCAGDMELTITSGSESSILYYSDGNIVAKQSTLYGTLYAPNGEVEFNGNPNNSLTGSILAKHKIKLNGAKVDIGFDQGKWMEELSASSKLIE